MNFSPLFPSNFGDFSQNISTPTEQQHPLAQNPSGKTEYMAFPKPFESSSSVGAEKQRYYYLLLALTFVIVYNYT
jgi:pericentriolar material 1 protein